MRIGAAAPALALPGIDGGRRGSFDVARMRGSWVIVIFYPADFSFVCPTEVTGFSAAEPRFAGIGAKLLGVSADTLESHESWVKELGGVAFPLLADPDGSTIRSWEADDPSDPPRAQRATFIVSPEGIVLYSVTSARNVGRSVEETLRVARALQTGRMCPADWKPGTPTAG
jgi:peroxiredoxin 2/4